MQAQAKRRLIGAGIAIVGILLAVSIWMVVSGMVSDNKGTGADEKWDGVYRGHGGTFKNTLAEIDTPDPSIVYQDGYYYMTFTHNGADIMVMKSRTLDFRQAERKVVWYPPLETMYSANLWAPEIQFLLGKWYIYFAADNGINDHHRMYVLEADSDDPLGSYTFKGQVYDESNRWAIDGIALEHEGKLYFVWSGWEGEVNIQQNTYIAPMSDPLTISGPRVLISEPSFNWEKAGGPPYINEGQAILKNDGRVFLMYSGAGSWTPFYSIGALMLEPGLDPLDPVNWRKLDKPLLEMDAKAGVYGPGHNTFISSPDGQEDWIVYHATSSLHDGWNNRKARAQKIVWTDDGIPTLGLPLSLDTAITVPSGSGLFRAEHARDVDGALVFDSIPSAGATEVPILVHYHNETGAQSSIKILTNAMAESSILLPIAKDGNIGYASTLVKLTEGMNTVSLSAAEGVQIGAIEFPRFEAENAQAIGTASAEANPFASGWGAARLEDAESAIVFSSITVPATGVYQVRIAAANPSGRPASLEARVNGNKPVKLQVPATERNEFIAVDIELSLIAGPNHLTLMAATELLMIDYMDVWR